MRKILVIEDDASIRSRIVDTLELEGDDYIVVSANNGLEGVERAKTELPDLIISDVMMPGLDGYGVLREVRQHPSTSLTPFIFLSAKGDRDHQREGMLSGADDYLTKPFTIDELLKTVSAQLAKHTIQQAQAQQKLDALRESITVSLPHEIRTPLSSIIGFGELLRDYRSMSHENVLAAVEQICTNAQRLQRLTENFILYSQLEVARSSKDLTEALQINVSVLAQDIIARAAQRTAEEHNRLSDLRFDTASVTLAISAGHLTKIIEEIVDNACKFSSPNTAIAIKGQMIAASQGDQPYYALTITDSGRGMTTAQIENIGAYMQFDRKTHEQQGSGFGLILVKRIAEVYRGSISFTAAQNPSGTSVTLTLPVADEHASQKSMVI